MLLAGLLIVIGGGSLAALISVSPGVVLVTLFLVYNAAWVLVFQLTSEVRTYWSWRKLHHLLLGTFLGFLLSLGPLLMLAATGQGIPSHPAVPVQVIGLLATFLIVCWEELWFRGLPMNYMAKHLSPLTVCVFASSLFVLMHALNPAIVLWKAAPGLFLGGMLLATSFFVFQSGWFPLGLHFGWNQFNDNLGQMLLNTDYPDNRYWGENGVVPNLFLLIVLWGFVAILWRRPNQALVPPPAKQRSAQ